MDELDWPGRVVIVNENGVSVLSTADYSLLKNLPVIASGHCSTRDHLVVVEQKAWKTSLVFYRLEDFSRYARLPYAHPISLLTCSSDKVMTVSLQEVRIVDPYKNSRWVLARAEANAVALSSTRAAVCDRGGRVGVYSLTSKQLLTSSKGDPNPTCATFLPSGDLAVGSMERKVKIWRVTAGALILIHEIGLFRDKIRGIGTTDERTTAGLMWVLTQDSGVSIWKGKTRVSTVETEDYVKDVVVVGTNILTAGEFLSVWQAGKREEHGKASRLVLLEPLRRGLFLGCAVSVLLRGLLVKDLRGLISRYF